MATAHIVSFNHSRYAFTTINKAADAIKFFATLVPVEFIHDESKDRYYYTPRTDKDRLDLSMEVTQRFEPRKVALCLPAPKRGHRPCTVCESVSVKPGTACASCGTIMAL